MNKEGQLIIIISKNIVICLDCYQEQVNFSFPLGIKGSNDTNLLFVTDDN